MFHTLCGTDFHGCRELHTHESCLHEHGMTNTLDGGLPPSLSRLTGTLNQNGGTVNVSNSAFPTMTSQNVCSGKRSISGGNVKCTTEELISDD